ncbi:MAG: transcription antitermination factor NusB [Armatimonadetes bacterium]|nr:transcription antitermination factor NusB [Armatimonadota bacterium]
MSEGTSSRRAAREAAFRAGYATVVGHAAAEEALSSGQVGEPLDAGGQEFSKALYEAVVEGFATLAEHFKPFLASSWPLERIPMTDRILLSMACCELWSMPDVPPKVTISEYVALAKLYGTAESGKFVNAVLGKVLEQSPKQNWQPVPEPSKPVAASKKTTDKPRPKKKSAWVVKSEG